MKFLVIGLGSMGKRRIRCLRELQEPHIAGYDIREDRRKESEDKFRIKTFSDLKSAIKEISPNALIISVPPDKHHEYIKFAIKHGLPFFVEASVLDTMYKFFLKELSESSIVAAPSATLLFHPGIKIIGEIIQGGELGKLSNFILHSGQYLPDWHIYEKVKDYYVSNPDTGGGREIVPFELSWITKFVGFPKRVCGTFRKTINIDGAEKIDDTYNFVMDYGDYLASITVDVVSRRPIRRLLVNGDKKQLLWDWDFNIVKMFNPSKNHWEEFPYQMSKAAKAGWPVSRASPFFNPKSCWKRHQLDGSRWVTQPSNAAESAKRHGVQVSGLLSGEAGAGAGGFTTMIGTGNRSFMTSSTSTSR